MAFLLLATRIAPNPRIHQLIPRFFYSSITQCPGPKTPHFSMVDYLVSSFGFSPDKAARVSKPIAHLKSPDKPDAVGRFLEHHGFTESEIRTIIAMSPGILAVSVENSLNPKLLALRDTGLSESTLTQLILSNPQALQCRPTAHRINFWRDFFPGDETALSKAFKKNRGLANYDIDRIISPNLSLLQNHGFSTDYIRKIVLQVPTFIVTGVSLVEDRLLHAKELGFQPGTGMFLVALHALRVTREEFQRKRELLMSFGWSEDDFFDTVRRVPTFLGLTEKNLQAKMDFLMEEARFDLSFVKSYPKLFLFSLEKNLRPRFHILQKLESRGLSVNGRRFLSAINLKNKDFVEKYIHPHREVISKRDEAFLAACP